MAWTLHQLLKTKLEQRGITVTATRSDKGKDLDLVSRGKKSKGTDLFLSLHSNAASTPKAVRSYQQSNGLSIDGSVGPATWHHLLGV